MESKSEQEGVNEHITVPHYRIIQKSLEILGILIIFYFCSVWSSLGLLFSHYLLTYDLFFYLFLNQTYLFREFQNQYSPYWLQNCYQAGYFLLQPFNPMLFYISGITGIMVAVVLSLIKIER